MAVNLIDCTCSSKPRQSNVTSVAIAIESNVHIDIEETLITSNKIRSTLRIIARGVVKLCFTVLKSLIRRVACSRKVSLCFRSPVFLHAAKFYSHLNSAIHAHMFRLA